MEEHLSEDAIIGVFSYETTPEEANYGVAHIIDCPLCWALASGVVAFLKRAHSLVPGKAGRPVQWRFRDARDALIFLMETQELRSLGLLRAKGWWAELKELNPQEQASKVRSVAAVQKWEVVEAIIREAKLVCARDPYSGEHLAMTAHELVEHLPSGELSARVRDDLRLSAMTVVANSRRLAGNWQGSFSAISHARKYLLGGRIGHSAEAYLLSVHASLVCDTGL